MSSAAGPFLHGALALACLLVAIVFLKYWRLSRDRFFVWFFAAFASFAFGWALRAFVPTGDEHGYFMYLPRLFGFSLILLAILDKNRRRPDRVSR